MTRKINEILFNFNELPNAKRYRGCFIAIGILMMILGAFAIGFAQWATEFTVILLGFLLAGAGLLQIINGCYATRWAGFSLALLLGLFYVTAGIFCIFKPMQSATGISLLIAALLLVGGMFRLISSLRFHFNNWGWVFFNGLIAIFLGVLILAEWPESAIWVIGLFVGIDLFLMGAYWVRLSLGIAKK